MHSLFDGTYTALRNLEIHWALYGSVEEHTSPVSLNHDVLEAFRFYYPCHLCAYGVVSARSHSLVYLSWYQLSWFLSYAKPLPTTTDSMRHELSALRILNTILNKVIHLCNKLSRTRACNHHVLFHVLVPHCTWWSKLTMKQAYATSTIFGYHHSRIHYIYNTSVTAFRYQICIRKLLRM